jgi:hypothetical protein
MGDDEPSSEFRAKIASLQNRILSRPSRVRDDILLEHRNKLVVDSPFREALESQKRDNIALLHLVPLVHSKNLKYLYIFGRFFNDLFFEFLSLTRKVRLLE